MDRYSRNSRQSFDRIDQSDLHVGELSCYPENIGLSNEIQAMAGPRQPNRVKWQSWAAVLTVVIAGTASVTIVWHDGHAVDGDCIICQTRHQPVAFLLETHVVTEVKATRPARQAQATPWRPPHHASIIPARAPPV